jgi:chemotaxis methyl-accepting protein methylase
VQDYEHVCKEGEALLPEEFRDRIKFEPHDLFKPQAKNEGPQSVFFLRTILHDWSDKYACQILQAILSGMKPGDRIVLVETIMPDPGKDTEINQRLTR